MFGENRAFTSFTNWLGKSNVLDDNDLSNTSMIFSLMPSLNSNKGNVPYNYYATALALLAKNDAHLQFEASIFQTGRSMRESFQFNAARTSKMRF